MMSMIKTANVIGNGDSKRIYRDNGYFTVTCNLETNIRHDAVSIIDPQPIVWLENNGKTIDKPVWCRTSVSRMAIGKGMKMKFDECYKHITRMNSGQHAVQRLCELGYEHIHLWGFDSLFAITTASPTMDELIPRSYRKPSLKQEWHEHWVNIHNEYLDVQFTVHAPVPGTLTNDRTRFKWDRRVEIPR